jgi:hypothetical protein
MLTAQESGAAACAAVNGTSQKLLQLLHKRLRQLLRATLVLAMCAGLSAAAVTIWWLTSLDRLPDIGDPFDVVAFRAFSVPDDQNAFTYLQRAEESLTPSPGSLALTWSGADAEARKWVKANRHAIQLFQLGAAQSDGANPAGESAVSGQRSAFLVLLEGQRRQERGDTAGAWDCFGAVLRMANHIRRRGSLQQRQDLDAYWSRDLHQRLESWAADPRSTIPQLRNALDELLKAEPAPDWDSFAIKAGYLEMMRALEQPVGLLTREEIEWEYVYRLGDMQLSSGMIGCLSAARRFLLREPDRSRRVLRLLCANWLAEVETHVPRRRSPAVRASLSLQTSSSPSSKSTTSVPLYPVIPLAPARARTLSPEEVASWLVTTSDLKLRILVANSSQWPWSPDRLRHRRAFGQLVIMLAGKVYHRERGAPPPSEEALVGTYLKSLPDDGSDDVPDGPAATVRPSPSGR